MAQSDLVAGVTAAVALLAFVAAWQIALPIAVMLAVGVYVGMSLLLPASAQGLPSPDDADSAGPQRVVAEGRASVHQIRVGSQRVAASAARDRLLAIAGAGDCILADFAECPRHVPEAQFALQSLLAAAVTALDRQQKFERATGPAARRCMEVLEARVFPTIERGLQQLHSRLLQDDLRAVTVEVRTLDQLLDLEGLTEEEQAS